MVINVYDVNLYDVNLYDVRVSENIPINNSVVIQRSHLRKFNPILIAQFHFYTVRINTRINLM